MVCSFLGLIGEKLNMNLNFYRLSLDCYKAFLAVSGCLPNKLAAAFVEKNENSSTEDLKQAEENGLAKNGKITEEGSVIASIICNPVKTIVASNSSFGRIPICFFSYKEGFWAFVSIDYDNKLVTLLAPIENSGITSVAKDALIGKMQITNFSPFTITLSNDELIVYNLVLMLIGKKSKEKGEPLIPQDCRIKYEDLLLNREFAKQALSGELSSENSEILSMIKDPERCKNAINSLIAKQVLAKSPVVGFLQPGIAMFYRLAPQKGMFILSYSDLETKAGHKYYVFPSSILEVFADRNSLTFTAVKDIDYSLWNL